LSEIKGANAQLRAFTIAPAGVWEGSFFVHSVRDLFLTYLREDLPILDWMCPRKLIGIARHFCFSVVVPFLPLYCTKSAIFKDGEFRTQFIGFG